MTYRILLSLIWLFAAAIWTIPAVATILGILGILTYAEPLDRPQPPDRP
jgi:hypothetical protein